MQKLFSLFICVLPFATLLHSQIKKENNAIHTINVNTAAKLKNALANAAPGDSIVLNDGEYEGNFLIENNGTAQKPTTLSGSRKAVLKGTTTNTGYVLHLQASYWVLKGFSIENGLKGLVADGANYNIIDGIAVSHIGEEGIHFRKFSSHNILQNAVVSNTGIKTPDYGEGVYIGSAVSNWAKYTDGAADKSDSNRIIQNTIGPNCTAECIDVKEGTTGGFISGNHFNSAGITGANSGDSWMDVKGNGYLIENNTGYNPQGTVLKDGYQVHCAVDGWGNNNVFKNNTSTVNAIGYGINITLHGSKGNTSGNKVFASNTVQDAQSGVANIVFTTE